MKINIDNLDKTLNYFKVGNILTLKRKEAEHDENIQDIITVVVSEDKDGNIVFLNKDYTFYSEYYQEFTSDHKILECKNVYGNSYNGYANKILDGCLIISNDECDDEIHYFLCSSNENDFYLVDINKAYTYDASTEFNIDVSNIKDDMYILNEIFEREGLKLIEIIETNKLELRRINNNDNSEKSNDLILDIVKAYERLAISVDSENAYDLNREEMDLNVVYSDDGKYHCHLDVLWDEVHDFDTFDNMIEIDEKDKDKDVLKLFIRLYVFRDGNIIGIKEIELSELITMDDRQLDKYMVDFLNEYI